MRNDEILTVKETADLLKTTRQQVRKMIANEELPAVKVGREWRVLRCLVPVCHGILPFPYAHPHRDCLKIPFQSKSLELPQN